MVINDNQLIPYYLMSCYLYYKKNEQVLTDKEFDDLCRELYEKWEQLDHPHKKLINKELLLANTGYSIIFPNIVKQSAFDWLEETKNKSKNTMEDIFE